jgi:hypothetical protein
MARRVRVLFGLGLLVGSLATATVARAAGEVVLAVSPSEVVVGEPVEVLLRTFRVVDRSDLSLPFETPIAPYPVSSGVWDILYPWADYPFDVVGQHSGDVDVVVKLARDPSDSTLWRGTMSLPAAGTWTIWIRNFPGKEPGSTATVIVRPGGPASTSTAGTPAIELGPAAALFGGLTGLILGALATMVWRRRSPS